MQSFIPKKKGDCCQVSSENMKNERQEPSIIPLGRVQTICQQCPARRSEVDLKLLHEFVSSQTELALDPLWQFLPFIHQLRLCRHLRYTTHATDTRMYLDAQNMNLNLFIKGQAEVESTGTKLSLCASKGPTLGKIHVPRSIQRLIHHTSPTNDAFDKEHDCFYTKIITMKQLDHNIPPKAAGRSSVFFFKGSHCLYLNALDLRPFMENLFDRLISQRVLNHLHLNSLRGKGLNLVTFPQGHPILLEGEKSDKIILTLRGKCELNKIVESIKVEADNGLFTLSEENDSDTATIQDANTELVQNETMSIGHVPPMTFLGFLPFYKQDIQDIDIDNDKNCQHPFTVIAKSISGVRCLVLDANAFTSEVRKTPIVHKAFLHLAKRQWNFLERTLPLQLAARLYSKKESNVEPFPHASMMELEHLLEKALQRRPRLNRQRVLSKLKQLVNGEEEEQESDDAFDDSINFDTCLSKKLFESIEEDWGEGSVVDFLDPCPSVVNRKFHGKTLPIVQRSKHFEAYNRTRPRH